ncbi:hypothetical protein M8J76_015425 [Diaphorina citri]|nr:hypothetical protein M8J76_015425 [Diaphorina citri]
MSLQTQLPSLIFHQMAFEPPNSMNLIVPAAKLPTNYTGDVANITSPYFNVTSPLVTSPTVYALVAYASLFLVAGVGNVSILFSLCCARRHRISRVSLMIINLCLADMMVTFVIMPVEITWRITVQWSFGDLWCRLFSFFRAFGLYLSSGVVVCVSLDRYFAIKYPLRAVEGQSRSRWMLVIAYAISFICSVPQIYIFHVASPPGHPNFTQCVSFNSFASDTHERYYNYFTVVVMYVIPMCIIVFSYFNIYVEVSKRKGINFCGTNRALRGNIIDNSNVKLATVLDSTPGGTIRLRMNDVSNINKTRIRTLKMTVIIVLTFFWCWTPYVIMTVWYMIDRESAHTVINEDLQDILFMMAVSNSCVNPLIYGTYTRFLKFGTHGCVWPCCWRAFNQAQTDSTLRNTRNQNNQYRRGWG